jgi:hypothetical protein
MSNHCLLPICPGKRYSAAELVHRTGKPALQFKVVAPVNIPIVLILVALAAYRISPEVAHKMAGIDLPGRPVRPQSILAAGTVTGDSCKRPTLVVEFVVFAG